MGDCCTFEAGRSRRTPALPPVWARCLILLAALLTGWSGRAQESGSVSGVVVSSWDGAPLAGVTVTVRGTTLATQTDATGRFELKNLPPGDQVLRISRSGYAASVVTDVRIIAGQSTTVNGNLRPEFYEMEEYEVTAEEFTQQTEQILIERQQSSSMMDAIGAEQFAKLGAGDAAEAMAKVTGTTIVEGKFAVIRGLSDRYTSATLNGGEIPSADPYRKAAQLDLFPSDMIDRISVTKTFTPDQPGGFTGGAIDILTRSFPEKFVFKLSAGTSYNTEATFNDDFLSYPGGGRDWTGLDDGTRDEPDLLTGIPNIAAEPSLFRISDYGSATAAEAAARQYQDYLRAFSTRELGGTKDAPPLDHDFAFSIGDTARVFNRRLGWFAGFSYEREFRHIEGEQMRYTWPTVPPGDPVDGANPRADLTDTRSTASTAWGGTVNLAYELSPEHVFGFTFLDTQNAEDVTRLRVGEASFTHFVEGNTAYLNELHWTERNLQSFQLRGDHKFPALGRLEADWLVSLATTTQDEPDYRLFNFIETSPGEVTVSGSSGTPEPAGGPTRYFRNLEEDNTTVKLDFALPFDVWRGEEARFKFGGYQSESDRSFIERTYTYRPGSSEFNNVDPFALPNQFLSDEQLSYQEFRDSRGNLVGYQARTQFTDEVANSFFDGTQEIRAGYGMLELPLVERLKLIGGARIESTDLGVVSGSKLGGSGENDISQVDVLPAAGLIYEVITNMNVRFNFAQTVARPTFREFSRLRSYDPTGDEIFVGNPQLEMSSVDNYDLRWEWFRRPGEVLSAGVFYKNIIGPIEKVALNARVNDEISYINSPEATVYGVEFEARTSLDVLEENLKNFSVGLNAAYIVSEVENTAQIEATKAEVGLDEPTRPLYDQSPYIVNADLTFESPRSRTVVTLAFNVSGERLYLVNNVGYDVYEQPAPALDFFITQGLGRHWKVKFSAKNLLDPDIKRIYGPSGETDGELIYSRYHRGLTFGLSLSCEF